MPLASNKNRNYAGRWKILLRISLLLGLCAVVSATSLAGQSSGDGAAMPDQPVLGGRAESLTQLSLGSEAFSFPEPFLVQRDEEPEFTREFYRVEWRTGDPIDFYVIRPAHVLRPPVTIFLYGFPSETDRFRDPAWCRMATRRGYAAVGFVSALTGQRFHGRGLTDWFVGELPLALVETVHDVQMAVRYLDTRKDLDAAQLGIFGQGSGGAIAVLAGGVEPRLRRIDLVDPWGDWPAWLAGSPAILDDERPRLTAQEFAARLAGLDPVVFLPKIEASRVQLLDVAYDRDTPVAAKRAIESATAKGTEILQFETPAEFQAGVGGGDKLLDWLQPAPAAQMKDRAEQVHSKRGN